MFYMTHTIAASVVIPTFNRKHVLRNTLLSLKRQSYPTAQYQIIIVDDGSTDETEEYVKSLNIDNLLFIKNTHGGPAVARNTGWKAADGNLIIFCDSDFIVPYTYIENHVIIHEENQYLALSGMGHWHYILSYNFKNLWKQKRDLKQALKNPIIKRLVKASRDGHLLNESDIIHNRLQPFLYCPPIYKKWVSLFEEIINTYGEEQENFHLPWLTFCTGNVSIRKSHLENLDGFDELLREHEDWELGYRIYLDGGTFHFSKDVEAYQQLTPPSNKNRREQAHYSYQYLCQKHPSIDMWLTVLLKNNIVSFVELSTILDQHRQIANKSSHFSTLTHHFEQMVLLYMKGNTPPLFDSITQTTHSYDILKAREELKHAGNFKEWLYAFDYLAYNL